MVARDQEIAIVKVACQAFTNSQRLWQLPAWRLAHKLIFQMTQRILANLAFNTAKCALALRTLNALNVNKNTMLTLLKHPFSGNCPAGMYFDADNIGCEGIILISFVGIIVI